MGISERIQQIRIDNGLSQDQFAEIFNVSRQAVSNWETGKNLPDVKNLMKLSIRFGIPLDELIKED